MTEFHILGPGAIGSLFACHLHKAGFHTALISRTPSEDARLIALEEHERTETHAFTIDKNDAPIRRLLVTVKAHQTEAALKSIQQRITQDTLIILLQNGMGSWHVVETLFPSTPYLLATTTEGVYRAKDHHIVHAGRGTTWVGSHNSSWKEKAQALVQAWQPVELSVEYDNEILTRLWQKLAINCAINPLTVLYDCKNGELLKIAEAKQDMKLLCDEVQQVLQHAIQTSPSQSLLSIVEEVAIKTGDNVSSMLQDYRQGKPTEIEFITGYLVQQAAKLAVDVPNNQRILNAIRAISF